MIPVNTFQAVKAEAKSIREMLDKNKYEIDVFQREYEWERKHVEQLIADLSTKFLFSYKPTHERKEVAKYTKYFLGTVILSEKDNRRLIIDGQQRLTSITLLLIYLNNLQRPKPEGERVDINNLIFSEKFSVKSYNLQIKEREACMHALYSNQRDSFDATTKDESVINILARYDNINELFPDELKDHALPYFIDWLIENVTFVEIKTLTDEDAYTIFETMNDRGLNLTPTEMLKGYLLSNIDSPEKKNEANNLWKERIAELKAVDKEEDMEFCKAWLRAKYAQTIRQGIVGAEDRDFEKIATRFHAWVKSNEGQIGLKTSTDFYEFIERDFKFYSKLYLEINKAANQFDKSLEYVFYLEWRGLARSLYFPLLLAPINVTDDEPTIKKKLSIVSRYLETFMVYRSVNGRTFSQSSIRYTMYTLVRDLRGKSVVELAGILKRKASEFEEGLDGISQLALHGQNRKFIHFLLARITRHIEEMSGLASSFTDYVNPNLKKPFQIEHIWADKFDQHQDEFTQTSEFLDFRNKVGDLILVPEGFNQSYGSLPYEQKLPHYYGQNLLAKTLSPHCYQANPSFIRYKDSSGIPFRPYEHFKKDGILERQRLYQKICEEIWDTNGFKKIADS